MKRLYVLLAIALFVCNFKAFSQGQKNQRIDYAASTENAWRKISANAAKATNNVRIIPTDTTRGAFALFRGKYELNSTLAAFVFNCGGMMVDNGWLRVIGSGSAEFNRGIVEWNNGKCKPDKDGVKFLMIADDVVGGFFALYLTPTSNFEKAMVYYQGPNDREWVSTGLDYPAFLNFCFTGEVEMFYNNYHWTGWQEEIRMINNNQTISCYPEFWLEGAKDTKLKRRVIPVQRLWELYNPNVKEL